MSPFRNLALALSIMLATAVSGEAQASAGSLHVISGPGVRVYVDNKFAGLTSAEDSGLRVASLPAGEHRVRIEKAGIQPQRFVITIVEGTEVEVNVARLQVRRRIRRKPSEEPVERTVSSPPMLLDDSDTPGDKHWELNLVFEGDLSHDSDVWEVPVADLNYGLGDKLQLKYEVPYVLTRDVETDESGEEHTVRAHGVANSSVGVKYRFYDNDETNLSLAIYPQVEFTTPGSKSREDGGVAEGGTTWSLPLLLTRDLEHMSTTANLDVLKSTRDPHAHIFGGVGLGARLSNKVAILGEVAGNNLDNNDERRITFDLGFRWKINELHAVVAAVGSDLYAADRHTHHYVTLGYQKFIGK